MTNKQKKRKELEEIADSELYINSEVNNSRPGGYKQALGPKRLRG